MVKAMQSIGAVMASTDNLSFYHKVLLPCLVASMLGMGATQIVLLQSTARLEEKVNVLNINISGAYTNSQASSDWKYQQMIDAEQNKRMDALEIQIKSHATQIYNIRKAE